MSAITYQRTDKVYDRLHRETLSWPTLIADSIYGWGLAIAFSTQAIWAGIRRA